MSTGAAGLDHDRLRAAIGSTVELHCMGRVGSTNDELRRLADAGAASGTVVVADAQHAGRGRHGRHWHSPPGHGVYLSLLIRPDGPPRLVARWTLVAGVGVCRAIRQLGVGDAVLKWPNDVLCHGRKLGGVLVESRTQGERVGELIMGVGVNVSAFGIDAPAELRSRATSIADATGRSEAPDRETVVSSIVTQLRRACATLGADGWAELAAAWTEFAPDAVGAEVEVSDPDSAWRGRTAGLDDDGALLVRRVDGSLRRVRLAGSVRRLVED